MIVYASFHPREGPICTETRSSNFVVPFPIRVLVVAVVLRQSFGCPIIFNSFLSRCFLHTMILVSLWNGIAYSS